MNYLDQAGLQYFWTKIKSYVQDGSHIDGSTITNIDWNHITNKPTWLQDGDVDWNDITGKPSTFTPSSHTHTTNDITNFPTFATINGQSITNGGNIVISTEGGEADSIDWDNIYGMPNGVVTSVSITGSGNAVTNASFSNHTLTLTKGTIEPGEGADGNYYPNNLSLSVSGNTLTVNLTGPGVSLSDDVILPSNGDGGSDGNNYPTGVTLSNSGNNLSVSISRSGLSAISDTLTFKTINGESIFGSGNIVVEGGDGGDGNTYPTQFSLSAGDTVLSAAMTLNSGTAFRETVNFKTINGASIFGTGDISIDSGISQTTADGRYIKRTGDSGMTGSYTFSSSTSITAGSFYESSDVNLKENIKPIEVNAVNAADCLALKQFNFKGNDTTKYGVIAQEVEAVGLNNLVKEDEEGKKSVDYISLLILKIEALEKRIAKLEAERG